MMDCDGFRVGQNGWNEVGGMDRTECHGMAGMIDWVVGTDIYQV